MDEYNDYEYAESINGTERPCRMESRRQAERILSIYVHPIVCIFGLLGNALVVVTYSLYKRAKSMTDVYLLNVAVSDLMFVVSLPLIIYNELHQWSMGSWMCKLLRGMYSVNLYSGMLLLACISCDRYIAIVQARRSFRIRSRAMAYSWAICVIVWLLALGLSIPTFVYYEAYSETTDYESGIMLDYIANNSTDSYSDSDSDSDSVCDFMFSSNSTAQIMKVAVPSIQVAVGFCLPFLVMGFCYSSIILTLLRVKNFQRHKAVRVVMAVVVVFIACHLPYNVTLLYHIVELFNEKECDHTQDIMMALTVTESLAYLHCCLNPVLYAFIGVKFRNHFRKIVEDLWCMGKRYIYSRRSSRFTSEMYISRKSTDMSNNENASSFTM